MDFALFLDFDGTIIENFSWDIVRTYYGVPAGSWLKDVKSGKRTVQEWYLNDMKLILQRFDMKDLDGMMSRLKKREGFDSFMEDYSGRFERVAVVSTGFPEIVRRFSEEHGMENFVSTYEYDGKNFSGRVLDGERKANVLKGFARNHRVVYVADDPYKGYEVEDHGENVLRICMGEGDREHVVHSFSELGGLLDKVLANPGGYFK